MKHSRFSLLKNIYKNNIERGIFYIDLSINKYSDIFNELDHSPFKKKDLDQDVVSYLENCSDDIPLKYKIYLHIVGPSGIMDEEKEKLVRDGLFTYFNFALLSIKKEYKSSLKKALQYMLISFIFLALSFYIEGSIKDTIIGNTLLEGVSIGGWVFLWEATAMIFFKNKDKKIRIKQYLRLLESKITFEYI